MPDRILLATLNAKYIHASLGLRYLLANMARHGGSDLRAVTTLHEFTIHRPAQEVVNALLGALDAPVEPGETGDAQACGQASVQIVGFGVYIWNVLQTTEVVRLLKVQRPAVKVILGGPEVSHEIAAPHAQPDIVKWADHVITGWGDVSFPQLCRALIHGPQPLMKVIAGVQPPLDQLTLPYQEYSAEDLAHRVLYVEASRGCPFKCEFCLSALDKTAWAFDLDAFMTEMAALYARGARNFKFVDRTFNLKVEHSVRILQFFLDRMQVAGGVPDLFVHFEVVPDSLPDRLKELIVQFPAGSLQFEVGVQSFNPEVQQRISRKQDNTKTADNLRWLVTQSQAHVHADLIFGLPGETLDSFAQGFDRLYALRPHEIQFGILKRLRGTPITRHTADFAMVYDPQTPYTILQNSTIDFATLQRIQRFARYWDMVANSGRFMRARTLLLEGTEALPVAAFDAFLNFSDWLWATTGKTHEFAYEKLVDLLFAYLRTERGLPPAVVRETLLADYQASGARGKPTCLAEALQAIAQPLTPAGQARAQRQGRHVSQGQGV